MKKPWKPVAVGTSLVLGTVAVLALVLVFSRRPSPSPSPPPPPAAPAPPRVRAVGAAVPRPPRGTPPPSRPHTREVDVVCGLDPGTASRYQRRDAALRNLPAEDVLALLEYVCGNDGDLRVERAAALKNDVLNLLRRQRRPPEGLADVLVGMLEDGGYADVELDYAVQHLGALVDSVRDAACLARIRAVLSATAARTDRPFAGTALYALADDRRADATPDGRLRLRRLTVALVRKADAHAVVRIAAILLAGQKGYSEVRPDLRRLVSGPVRDVPLALAAVGTLGLVGTAGDIPLLQGLSGHLRLAHAVHEAVRRIRERSAP